MTTMETQVEKEIDIREIPINRAASRALDESLNHEERVSLALQSYGQREVYQTIDDLAGKTGMRPSSVYTALWRMAKKGRIEILKERVDGAGFERICGVKLNYAITPDTILEKGVEKAKHESKTLARKFEPKVSASLVNLDKYMQKKIAIEKVKAILQEQEMLDGATLPFEEDSYAEEAIAIYKELIETKRQLGEALLEIEALRRKADAR